MAKKNEAVGSKNKGGRPHKKIDQIGFEKLCQMMCTRDEICAFFETTDKTLNEWCKRTYGEGFSAVYAQKREQGKISLRHSQLQLAKKSAAMAIFLGKNYLGQTDKCEVTAKGVDEQVVADVTEYLKGKKNN